MDFNCTHTLKGLHENGCKPFDCMANSTWKCSEDNNEQSMPCPTVPFWQVQLPFQVGAHTYCKLRLKQKDCVGRQIMCTTYVCIVMSMEGRISDSHYNTDRKQ